MFLRRNERRGVITLTPRMYVVCTTSRLYLAYGYRVRTTEQQHVSFSRKAVRSVRSVKYIRRLTQSFTDHGTVQSSVFHVSELKPYIEEKSTVLQNIHSTVYIVCTHSTPTTQNITDHRVRRRALCTRRLTSSADSPMT